MKSIECTKCSTQIRSCNFQRHFDSCNGLYKPFRKATHCKYCNIDLINFETANRANHIRWCDKNPKKSEYKTKNNGSQLKTKEAVEKRKLGLKKAHADGKYSHLDYSWNIGRPHTEETKERLRDKALASKHRRLVRSVRDYIKPDGTIIKLDSSWEESLARRLDQLNIEWIRPENPIPWKDSKGRTHNYFPDFYLPKYDLFLDPKNSYAIASQKEKLDVLTKQVKNLIIIKTLEECQTFTF
jgi:hypothetical protein